jgi:biopolymer transport protein ExbD
MGMSVGSGGGEGSPMIEMNTTPLIDVMLVLLIMLIVTLPIMTHAVKLDMPRGDPPPKTVEPVVITIQIDYDGSILWNGTLVPSLGQLERFIRQEAERVPQPEFHIRPDQRAKYDTVAKVLAITQRSGIEKMGIIGSEQFLE